MLRMGGVEYIDTVVVPMSVFLAVGYHVFLWHSFRQNPARTSLGIHSLQRSSWLRDIKQGDGKTGMLAVQSLRNTKMVAILTATIAILVYLSLAAATNNSFMGSHLFGSQVLSGSHRDTIFVVKYGAAAVVMGTSFFCSSMGVGYLVDAIFLINAMDMDMEMDMDMDMENARMVMERGFLMSTLGGRVMCIGIPLLLWLFGPLPVAASSLTLVFLLYHFDFPPLS